MKDHDDTGYDAAQERRAEEREDDLRQAGRFPYGPVDWKEPIRAGNRSLAVGNVVQALPPAPEGILVKPGDVRVWQSDAAGAFSQIPIDVPGGTVVCAGQRLGVVLDTDENGDLRGRVAVDDIAGAISQAEDASSLEEDDEDDPGLSLRDMPDDLVAAILDHDDASPDPDDEAVIRHATATVERPAPPLPAAELFFAAACKATSAVRSDTTTTAGLRNALRAASLARELAEQLERSIGEARDLRDRTFPKGCYCGAVYSREQWRALESHGVQHDDEGDLDLRMCAAPECRSTLAMPVGA